MRRVGSILMLLCFAIPVVAATSAEPVPLEAASSPIEIDGVLSDPAWQSARRYDVWYETNPGDNVAPKVKTVGYVTYDARFLYVGIEASDPNPNAISGPYADHDQISGSSDDFAGVILDTRNDGKTGAEFFVSARGVQYDAVQDDSGSGEDASPDWFWDSAARVHETGYTVEIRIPFSTLRYDNPNPAQWGLMLYRNYPRDRRYQIFTNKLPRESSCFVCTFGKITGLRNLPAGDHLVVAPYLTAQQLGEPRSGLGSDLVNHQVGGEAGLDLKWNPSADTAVDATINPDFSQVESDVAVISTNERFAIFIEEKRPFFLEGVELFSTPVQAVYTRTLTSPRWGARTTGKSGDYAYTLLVAQDRGGGSVILPSAFGSGLAAQDFSSLALIGRVRRDFGKSFLSFLTTARQTEDGAYNRVFGPDFQYRPNDQLTLTGQLLLSRSETPNRPDLAEEWNGQKLDGHALRTTFVHFTAKTDFYVNYSDYGKGFRADNGFVPQVDWRGSYLEAGRTYRPDGFFSRVRVYGLGEYDETQAGNLLYRMVSAGIGADGRHRSFFRLRYQRDTVNNDGPLFDRDRIYYTVQFAVNRVLSSVAVDGWVGDDVDFVRNRPGRGASINATATLRPTHHLQLGLTSNVRWLSLAGDRLFTSQVERIRATYTFNARTFLRAIVQNQRTNQDTALYRFDEDERHSGSLATQLLFAYKVNWQTVFYIGFGDLQETIGREEDLLQSDRQFFAKVSYAFQR